MGLLPSGNRYRPARALGADRSGLTRAQARRLVAERSNAPTVACSHDCPSTSHARRCSFKSPRELSLLNC